MKVWKEIDSINEFEPWSGAVDTVNHLTSDQIDQLDSMLDDLFPEGCSETEFNDWLSFEDDYIAELLGFEDWEDLLNHEEDEE